MCCWQHFPCWQIFKKDGLKHSCDKWSQGVEWKIHGELLFWKISAGIYLAWFNKLVPEALTNVPGGNVGPDRRISRWLGVRSSGFPGSSETLLNGHPLMMDSTSHSKVSSASLSSGWSLRSAFITLRVVRIHHSQTPPWCEPAEGLMTHAMLLARRNL